MRTALRGYSSHWRERYVQHSSEAGSSSTAKPSKQQPSQAAAQQQPSKHHDSSSTAQASKQHRHSSITQQHSTHSHPPPYPYPTSQQVNPHGWITSITSSGVQNLKTLSRPLVEVSAVKALQARAEFELTSAKAGEIAPGASVYLLSVRQTADLAWRVGFASEGEEEGGIKAWVTAITKDGLENFKVSVPAAAAQ